MSSDGYFETKIITGGSKWSTEGSYTILVTYAGNTQEKIIHFSISNKPTNSNTETQEKEGASNPIPKEFTETIPSQQNLRYCYQK